MLIIINYVARENKHKNYFYEIDFKEVSISLYINFTQTTEIECTLRNFKAPQAAKYLASFSSMTRVTRRNPLSRRIGRRGGVFAWVFRGRVVWSLRLARPTGSSLRAF